MSWSCLNCSESNIWWEQTIIQADLTSTVTNWLIKITLVLTALLIADTPEKLQELVTGLVDARDIRGLTINKKKTEVMVTTKKTDYPKIRILVEGRCPTQVE